MKVLWFANTPCNAVEHMKEKTIGGGWLQTLDIHMQEKVELHIAFYANWAEQSFTCRKSTYHVIPPDSVRASNIKNIIYPHVIHKEDTARYMAIIDKVKPDLIHVHGTENAYGTFLSQVNVPVVVSIQGIMTPYAYRFKADAGEDMRTSIGKSGKTFRAWLFEKSQRHQYELLKLIAERESKYVHQVKYFIGRTDWDRRVSTVMSPGSTYFVGDEIMRDEFYTTQWKPKTERKKFIIHTTSSDSPMKGFKTVADAVNLLKAMGLDIEWRVAGISADSAVVRIAKKQMGKSYPSDAIKLLGRIGAKELASRMQEADLFVLPSYMENSPNSLCEAMLMSMPCISTNGGGTPSMLANNEEGILIQPGDPWSMAGAVVEVMNNYDRAVAMGQQAQKRAVQRHDPRRIVEQVYAAYQHIAGENGI